MSEVLIAQPRTGKFNKNAARRIRVAGQIPAVVYGSTLEPIALTVDPKQVDSILFSDLGHNSIFELDVTGKEKTKAMIVDVQREPINDKLIHVDIKRIDVTKVMRTKVAIKLIGTSVGVKAGGILDHVMREIEIECLPTDIPAHIDIDITNMQMGAMARVSDLPHGGKIKFLADESATVVHIIVVKQEAPTEEAAPAKKGKK